MALTDSAGLLFRIRADGSQAKREIKDVEADVSGMSGTSISAFNAISGGAAIAAAGILAISAAALKAATTLFELSQNAAAYGSEIFNASVKTGLTTETISALKLASERTGVSMESLGTIVSRFSRLVGEAEQGSDKAKETLKRLGVDPKEAINNLDAALGKVFLRIQNLPDPISKATLAQQAFGKAGTELLKVIDDFNGDLPGAIAKARELGLVMSQEDAAAADEFGDQMDTLRAQLRGVGVTIGKEFMPEFLRMAEGMSDFLARNKGQIADWAHNLRQTLRGVIESFNDAKAAYGDYIESIIRFTARLDPLTRAIVGTIYGLREKGEAAINSDPLRGRSAGQIGDPNTFRDFGAEEDARKEAEREREAARKKAEQLAERDLIAQIRIESTNLKTIQEQAVALYEEQRKKLGEGKTSIAGFIKTADEATTSWGDNLRRSLTYLEELERRALKNDATEHERALLEQQQAERRNQIEKKGEEERRKNADALHERRKKIWEETLEQAAREADYAQYLYEMEQKRLEARREFLQLDVPPPVSSLPLPGLEPDAPPEDYDPFQSWIDSWKRFVDQIYADGPTLTQTLEAIGGILTSAFEGMANAIGSVVEQWVLYGKTGPAIMRKILASALATIAAEAAVRAIFELAMGFAALFLNPAEAAAHFTAAALFGSIAAGAALAGRAVAGNAFQRQAETAAGPRATGSNTQGSRAEPGAYSGLEDQKIEMGINQPAFAGASITVKFEEKTGILGQLFAMEIQRNGPLRQLIIDTANA